jgi:hypothetical protein
MKRSILLISVFSLLYTACKFDVASQYTYRPPEKINDGFDVGSLVEVNIDPALIEQAVNEIYSGRLKEVHAMLIFKDNRLVFEEYFEGHKYRWDAA